MDRLTETSNDPLESELAGLTKSDAHKAGAILRKLALKEEGGGLEVSKRKWIYLVLLDLFQSRGNFAARSVRFRKSMLTLITLRRSNLLLDICPQLMDRIRHSMALPKMKRDSLNSGGNCYLSNSAT